MHTFVPLSVLLPTRKGPTDRLSLQFTNCSSTLFMAAGEGSCIQETVADQLQSNFDLRWEGESLQSRVGLQLVSFILLTAVTHPPLLRVGMQLVSCVFLTVVTLPPAEGGRSHASSRIHEQKCSLAFKWCKEHGGQERFFSFHGPKNYIYCL